MKSAKLSLGNDGLIVVLENGVASDYFMLHPENKARLEALLSDFSGKDIRVDIQTVSGPQEFERNYADLSQIIQMEIDEEDDE